MRIPGFQAMMSAVRFAGRTESDGLPDQVDASVWQRLLKAEAEGLLANEFFSVWETRTLPVDPEVPIRKTKSGGYELRLPLVFITRVPGPEVAVVPVTLSPEGRIYGIGGKPVHIYAGLHHVEDGRIKIAVEEFLEEQLKAHQVRLAPEQLSRRRRPMLRPRR